MQSILEIDSVTQSYGNRQVLSDIYLKCQTGDIIGMLGRNGTGKSTLLKILFGSLKGDNKFIRIDGKVYGQPFKVPGLVGYLPQHNFLLQHLTVNKIMALYLTPDKIPSFVDDAIISKIQKNKVSHLSGGELRYLEIKLILHTNNKFVFLDEPFNGVAPLMVEQLKKMINDHARTKGIILTDHDYKNVLDVANRYCLIYDGGIKNIENKDDLVKWRYLSGNS